MGWMFIKELPYQNYKVVIAGGKNVDELEFIGQL